MKAGITYISLAIALALPACYMGEPIPVECVCQCEQEATTAKSVPRIPTLPRTGNVAAKVGAKDVARAKTLAAKKAAAVAKGVSPVAKRVADAARRAEGRVARQPGSGEIMKTDPRTRQAMVTTYTGFLKGATRRKLEPLKSMLTKRLYGSLEKNLPKYEDRFFNGLKDSIAAMRKGGMKVKETRDMGRGNVEALVTFENGHERRVIFFKEDGAWKLNRL